MIYDIYNISIVALIIVALILIAKRKDKTKTGTASTTQKENSMNSKQLSCSKKNKMITGVCGGIAEYFNQDPMIVRLLWVLASLASMGTGLLIYAIFAIFLPQAEAENIGAKPPEDTGESKK